MKKLDIIVPQYKEEDKIIRKLLHSINNQQGIDFDTIGILIINDCSNIKITKKLLSEFPKLNIELLENSQNVGPGVTRQFGIDHSTAEYITFIDADDTYFSRDSLQKALEILNRQSPNILLTQWMEEYKENNQIRNIRHFSDIIYLHGKFIKRQYLIDNKIRFSPNLRLHEDSYFSTLLLLTGKDIHKADIITNYWRLNINSIVRKKEKRHYLVRTFPELLASNKELFKELEKRDCPARWEYLIKSLTYLYCILCSAFFADQKDIPLQKLKIEYEFEFYKYLCENLEVFEKIDSTTIATYMNQQFQIFTTSTGLNGFLESWQDFITRLSNTYEEE
ncbi:glycosyltransferase family 2 protein [bacterium]|nr:glycosyltransferase family 2 protein [bacterium]